MNVLDLFSGIGGFSLGLERAGMRTVAFCEIEPYCQAVLRRHWPDIPIFDDVRTLTATDVSNAACQQMGTSGQSRINSGMVDLICGGFPCQDISVAGKGLGLAGSRSGLWKEYARLIGEIRPRYIIVENVSALLGRGLSDVLGDLATLGYDSEWHCVPASAVGAPHLRDRVWIIAYPQHTNTDSQRPYRAKMHIDGSVELRNKQICKPGSFREYVANGNQPRLERWIRTGLQECANEQSAWTRDPSTYDRTRQPESFVGRVAHGVPARMDRLKALGNAIVPQIAEIIGKAIMSHEQSVS